MGERKLWISFSVYIGFSRLIQRRRKFYFPRVRSLNANDMRFHQRGGRPPAFGGGVGAASKRRELSITVSRISVFPARALVSAWAGLFTLLDRHAGLAYTVLWWCFLARDVSSFFDTENKFCSILFFGEKSHAQKKFPYTR